MIGGGMSHRGMFRSGKKERDCSSYLPGLYTVSELDQMIFVDGYIPVANATEFDNIRTGNIETMGAGTCWENQYTTGGDKKYVQVLEIDFLGYSYSVPLSTGSSFVYDGNEINIINYNQIHGLFYQSGGEIRNIRIINAVVTSILSLSEIGVVVNRSTGGIISNCVVSATVSGGWRDGIICGEAGSLITSLTIEKCVAFGSVHSTGASSGGTAGIIGRGVGSISQKIYINNCVNYANASTGFDNVGGISGRIDFAEINQCASFASATASRYYAGGCFGLLFDNCTVNNCYSIGSVVGGRSAGFAAYIRNSTTVTNCYCVGTVTGSGISGFIHTSLTSSSASNSFWDTTIGMATSTAGTGQTTSALQTPTSNTGIYSAWSLAVWSFGTSSDYPSLINTP